MTTPVPFTPYALRLIREHAAQLCDTDIAARLGWDVGRVRRIAREHGIELCKAGPSAAVVMPAVEEEHSGRHDGSPRQPRGARPPKIEITADMTLDEIERALPFRQAQVLNLLRAQHNGLRITSVDLAERMRAPQASIQTYVHTLRQKLRPTRFDIEGCRHRGGGGYRLTEGAKP